MFFSHYFVFGTGHILDFHATEKEPQLKRKNLQRVSISSSLEIPFSKRCGRVRIAVCDQVGASSLRGHHVTVPNTPWSDIGGMEEVGGRSAGGGGAARARSWSWRARESVLLNARGTRMPPDVVASLSEAELEVGIAQRSGMYMKA